jgi:peptide/nickel transport system permease protein
VARDEPPFRRILAEFLANPSAVAGVALLGLVVVVALAAPWISPQSPYDFAQLDVGQARLPPGSVANNGGTFWLGTDDKGRDLLSAIFYGLRTSLAVGLVSTVIGLAVGLAAGLCAAYFGGFTETLILRVADVQLSFPAILIVVALLAVLGQGMGKIVAALVTVQWAYYARALGRAVRVERRKSYIEAAHGLALKPTRIIQGHVLPNCLPPLVAVAAVQVAAAIVLEATVSFLGLGLPSTEASLGLIIAGGYQDLLSGKYWMCFFPGVALLLTILSINLIADRLDEVLKPRLPR